MNPSEINYLRKRIYAYKQKKNSNDPFFPQIVFSDEELDYLIDLLHNNSHMIELCDTCLEGAHDNCKVKRAVYRSPDSILVYCVCDHSPIYGHSGMNIR